MCKSVKVNSIRVANHLIEHAAIKNGQTYAKPLRWIHDNKTHLCYQKEVSYISNIGKKDCEQRNIMQIIKNGARKDKTDSATHEWFIWVVVFIDGINQLVKPINIL